MNFKIILTLILIIITCVSCGVEHDGKIVKDKDGHYYKLNYYFGECYSCYTITEIDSMESTLK